MKRPPTLVLTRSNVAALVTPSETVAVVEEAFRIYGEGRAFSPSIVGIRSRHGGFHIKSGILTMGREYFASKTNANFPENRRRHGFPSIQGVVLLSDAENGRLLALVDSLEITNIRTGAATAVAAKHLSREDSATVTIFGCGHQGRSALRMLRVVREIDLAWAYDIDLSAAEVFAEEMSAELAIRVSVTRDPDVAVRASDMCVTCTPSKSPFLIRDWIRPGSFVAAIGADAENKQELDPSVIASSILVTDGTSQCATIGELHHALAAGLVRRDHVYAELGVIVAGRKPGRTGRDQIFVFDSTGMAFQDVATTALVYEKAVKNNIGLPVDLLQ
jgi:ornithine cyclodeaminase/alanine dehydrogenase-like protein (mu-crystallin family)